MIERVGRRIGILPPQAIRLQAEHQTTLRVRQLVDGLEEAVLGGDELEVARYLAPSLLPHLLPQWAEVRRAQGIWRPARSGLRWSRSRRRPDGPGLVWLRLRFEDMTRCDYPEGGRAAALRTHEVEVEVDTTGVPWRLVRVVERGET